MQHWNLWVPEPPKYPHFRSVRELAELLAGGLRDLGYSAAIRNAPDRGARNMVVGYHMLPPIQPEALRPDTILVNTEPVARDGNKNWNRIIWEWAPRFETWDYSEWNRVRFAEKGIQTKPLAIGHHRDLTRIGAAARQDIDVLFYGALSDRRRAVLEPLAKKANVQALFGVYGGDRDAFVARSKVVLNLHQNTAHIFEIVRCSYLMSNSKAIVAEVNAGTTIEDRYRAGIYASRYEDLVSSCLTLLENESLRREQEERAYRTITALPQSEILRGLL